MPSPRKSRGIPLVLCLSLLLGLHGISAQSGPGSPSPSSPNPSPSPSPSPSTPSPSPSPSSPTPSPSPSPSSSSPSPSPPLSVPSPSITTPTVAPGPTSTPATPTIESSSLSRPAGLIPKLHIKGTKFYTEGGSEFVFKGSTWYGYNTRQSFMEGLNAGSTSLTRDFPTVITRQLYLGFNAMRLPFVWGDLDQPTQGYTASCQFVSQDTLLASVTPSWYTGSSPLPPPMEDLIPSDLRSKPGLCNSEMPNGLTYDRYLWTVDALVRMGLYVIVDNHPGAMFKDETILDTQRWTERWVTLAKDIFATKTNRGRVFFNPVNEPDVFGFHWDKGTSWRCPQCDGLSDVYLGMMDAVWAATSTDCIFLLDGVGASDGLFGSRADGVDCRNLDCGSKAGDWGDGYMTDFNYTNPQPGLIIASNADVFLRKLVAKPYAGNFALAPHVYGQGVTQLYGDFGPKLFARLTASWGAKAKNGYAGKPIPVIIGEIGSILDAGDAPTMAGLVSYLTNVGPGASDDHPSVGSFFWWAWNPTSGDTKGMVLDNWLDIDWLRIDFMSRGLLGGSILPSNLGLRPWYMR